MTTAARPTRARRGRILIIGDIPELDWLLSQVELTAGPPVRAANVFEALGELTIAPAAAPIATVLLGTNAAHGASGRAVEALRKVDPSIRLIVIESGRPANASDWISRGADDCIALPISAADLSRLFDEDMLADGVSLESLGRLLERREKPVKSELPAGSAGMDVRSARSSIHEIPDDMTVPPAMTADAPRPVPASRAQIEAPSPPAPPAPSPTAAAPSQPEPPAPTSSSAKPEEVLGDTDLVEAILVGSGAVQSIGLKLIAQQTSWRDVALVLDDAAILQGAATAAVEFNDMNFGTLTSSHASAAQLQPWADWLARWLALDFAHQDSQAKSMQDDLTGAGNRRFFETFLNHALAQAAKDRRPVTLMVFDIDNFKTYNDQYGHDAGDDILCEIVKLMTSVIRQGDRVCRIGGDEFAVIFADADPPREPGSRHPESIETIAKRFQDQICKMKFPKLGSEAPGTLTISAGLATYPWDGADAIALLRRADQLALESKRKGKNVITFGQGAAKACRPPA